MYPIPILSAIYCKASNNYLDEQILPVFILAVYIFMHFLTIPQSNSSKQYPIMTTMDVGQTQKCIYEYRFLNMIFIHFRIKQNDYRIIKLKIRTPM